MGRRGPVSKPTAVKRSEGVRPARINDAEPVPAPSSGEPPEWLSEGARETWERLAPDLVAKGVLTSWDEEPFAMYCEAIDQARHARSMLRHGLLTKGRRDGLVTNPAFRAWRDCLGLVRLYAREFGCTPSGRGEIRTVEATAEDLMAEPPAGGGTR